MADSHENHQAGEPRGYQGASTPIKTVKRMINWFYIAFRLTCGGTSLLFGVAALLCFKLSWSSYHNLGESNPTNILFVPKYKSQSRLVLCSKHSQRDGDARVRISKDLKSTPFLYPLFIRLFSHNKDQLSGKNVYSYLKWRMAIA